MKREDEREGEGEEEGIGGFWGGWRKTEGEAGKGETKDEDGREVRNFGKRWG